MAITDSAAAFAARAKALGLDDAVLQLVVGGGLDTMSKFAFSSSYVPGQAQETPFVDSMKAVLRRDPTVPELAILRRLLHECFAMTSTALKQIVEKTDDTPARKLSQPERSDRLERQQARLTGVRIQGVYEPSDRLIDRLVQMYEDNRLSYIELQACTSKEFEVKHSSAKEDKTFMVDSSGSLKLKSKDSKLEADVTTDLLMRQAFTRRGLGMDQANLAGFEKHEEWAEKLFAARYRDPPQGYQRVTQQQMLNADAQLFVRLAELTRAGVQTTAAGRPLDIAWDAAINDSSVMHLLQPLPAPPPKATHERPSPYVKGGPKGKGGAKGRSPSMPLALKHGVPNTKTGKPLCFDYNLHKCTRKVTRGACAKGLHLCCICMKAGHHYLTCPELPKDE